MLRKTALLASLLCTSVLSAALFAASAQAGAVTFSLGTEFSGATAPEGPAPWLTATFDDSYGGPNTVRLTMTAGGLTDNEFVGKWYFNLDPALTPAGLSFAPVSSGATVNGINTGVNAFQADGDGSFDIEFDFAPPPGNFASKFTAGESVIYDITYTSALLASSFDFGSAPGGGNGTYRSAAHVQGIGPQNNDSGWIGGGFDNPPPPPQDVPEPFTLLLLGSGLGGLSMIRRRKLG
jgi:hypothetical protein